MTATSHIRTGETLAEAIERAGAEERAKLQADRTEISAKIRYQIETLKKESTLKALTPRIGRKISAKMIKEILAEL